MDLTGARRDPIAVSSDAFGTDFVIAWLPQTSQPGHEDVRANSSSLGTPGTNESMRLRKHSGLRLCEVRFDLMIESRRADTGGAGEMPRTPMKSSSWHTRDQ